MSTLTPEVIAQLAEHLEMMRQRDSIAEPIEKAEKFVRKMVPERVTLS